jgi:hypothetical protein
VVAAFLAVAAGRCVMGGGEDGEAVFALEEQCVDIIWQAGLRGRWDRECKARLVVGERREGRAGWKKSGAWSMARMMLERCWCW